MSELLAFVVAGIASGATYGLLGLGLVLVNKASGILNLAHGEVGVFATMVAASLMFSFDLPWPVAVIGAVITGGALSVGTRMAVLQTRSTGLLPPLVGTLGVVLALIVVEFLAFAEPVRTFESPFSGRGFDVAGVVITPTRAIVVVTSAVVCGALWLFLERTDIGLKIRATGSDSDAARIIGLRPARIETVTWLVAGCLAGLAGVLLGWLNVTISPAFLTLVLPKVLTAVILGGALSLPGAVVGGIAVGIAESVSRLYLGGVSGAPEIVVFAILLLTLLLRPEGLFGRSDRSLATEQSSGTLVRLPPMIRSRPGGELRRVFLLPLVVVAGVGIWQLEGITAFKLALVPIFVMVAWSLSTLVVTTGQVSLAHVGLMGLGAFMTGVAGATWEFPAVPAVLVGGVSTALVSLALGSVALRVRGLHLAVLTLSFAVVLESFVFPLPAFSGGGAGLSLARPELGFIDLSDDRWMLAACATAVLVMWYADRRLLHSPLGRAMLAVRDNEVATAARGIEPAPIKVLAFAISGFWVGIAGGLFAFRNGQIVSSAFPFLVSLSLVLYVVLGGIGIRWSVAAVTGLFVYMNEGTSASGTDLASDLFLLGGALFVVLSTGRYPQGLGGRLRELARSLQHRLGRDGPAAQDTAASVEQEVSV
ncbi:MAG: ABC transporter permease [Acidimicrobiales bacterium]|nr:ABC transporter permease [Acidimicrobiales bacterium]